MIVDEAVMMGLAPAIGRQHAHDVVYDGMPRRHRKRPHAVRVLKDNAQIRERLGDAQLRSLTDPANYLGAAAHMARRVASGT